MNKYTIYCTAEQTHKALELGAPIELLKYESTILQTTITLKGYAIIPTAEQMIGWLEEQYIYITIRYTNDVAKHWQADIDRATCIDHKCGKYLVDFNFSSRKRATLTAIDAALEYLSQNKK